LNLWIQELISIASKGCRDSRARVADLALFSPNETLEDISTQDLVYLFVPYVSAEIESRARAIERDERLARLREAEVCLARPFFLSYLEHTFLFLGQKGFTKFVSDIELYEIVSKSEHELYGKNASAITDPARRRETKIKQYQAEKEIRSRIEVNSFIRIFQVAPCGPPRTNAHPLQAIAERRRVPLPPSDTSPTDFDLIAALLPPSTPTPPP
jgi:immunoglobulin-binding protein 1